MSISHFESKPANSIGQFPMKIWIYTNYDCNLWCSYCVAESSPKADRKPLALETAKRIVDEAIALGFQNIYFTGGEPFLLDDIFEMLAYSAARIQTTVLTNGMLFRGKRLERLLAIQSESLTLQISLDGSTPEYHDPYRGSGSWQKTVDGIKKAKEHNFRVRISTTETSANAHHLDEICEFRRSLGIPDEDHFIRPLAKRGFSDEGMEVSKQNLVPELTINAEGVYWHPLSTDPDLLVIPEIFPLEKALSAAKTEFEKILQANATEVQEFQ
jgi:MoaA/NifB/PqqE/SkfB family radical SAM enzyme